MDALESIYRRHREGLFSLALSRLGCRELAEDAIQEAFASLCAKDHCGFDPTAYVFIAVRNAALDLGRRRKRREKLQQSLFNGFVHPARSLVSDSVEQMLDRERDEILRRSIDNLEPEQREIIILKAFAQLTFEQVAEILGVPLKTVASRYRRLLKRLENDLKGKL